MTKRQRYYAIFNEDMKIYQFRTPDQTDCYCIYPDKKTAKLEMRGVWGTICEVMVLRKKK